MNEFFSTFGVDPYKFLVQSLVVLVPSIWATFRVVRNRQGAALPLWLLFIWIVPFIGALITLLVVRKPEVQST